MKKLTLFLLLLFFQSCQIVPPLPNEPFACKVNGKTFRPEKDDSPIGGVGSSPLKVEWDKINGWFYISAWNDPDFVSISIKLPPNERIIINEYLLGNDIKNSVARYSYNSTAESNVRESLISTSGKVVITKVESDTKVWGTFEFKTKSVKQNKEYTITKGRFNDLNV